MWTRAELAKMLDLHVLRPDATLDDVMGACDEAVAQHLASVVVFPCWVAQAARRLGRNEVKLGTVIGYPLGATSTRVKVYEVQSAVANGAQELQAVINVSALKSREYTRFRRDLEEVLNAAHVTGLTDGAEETMTLFVLETGYLTGPEIDTVAELSREIGVEFLVTGTGYGLVGDPGEDVRRIRRAVGANMGVKAVGDIRTAEGALDLLNAGANRIGTPEALRVIEAYEPGEKREPVGERRR